MSTVTKWISELDPKNKWLKYIENDDKVSVKTIFCELFCDNFRSLKTMSNLNNSFINGIPGTGLQ